MKRKWIKSVIIIVGISFVVLMIIGLLFRDDDKLGGFITDEGEREFTQAYDTAMKDLPNPTKEFWVETEFGKVKVYKFSEEGTESKIPLLLLPGKSAPTPMWEPNLKDLMEDRPIYTIDLLGEPGLSVQTKSIVTANDQAVCLNNVIEHLPEETIHLAGLSFGGWNAVNVTLYESTKIASLSLIDPVYVFGPIPLKMILASIPASIPAVPQSIREKMLSYIAGGAETDGSEPISKLIETSMRTYKSKLPLPEKITEEQLKELKMPVLGILAEDSTMHHSQESMDVGLENLKHPLSHMVMFSNASHAINGEYPEKLAKNIVDFLHEVDINLNK
ncbi:alpha/beta fold hydrolase [Oceanobacillus kimchii]|uniref:Alpha/beta hydrolase n=1 Tax=Oceanobacillus kimchii TaxID=746691 RepID=A0ABQ5TMP2_9BACI|nr:alpha/beta hydrolase [Oceanobacillus kimchii]GLO68073.1 alpha/beta hydrolase [Oceanobacillus kimchii]